MLPGTPRTFIGSTTFTVRGMTTTPEPDSLVEHVGAVPGVESVTVDALGSTVTVRATTPVDRADVAAAVLRAGYAVVA